MNSGVLYVATGAKYIEEARRSARTVRRAHDEILICLITDHDVSHEEFDLVKVVGFESISETSWKANLIYKIVGIANSPFESTIFLDTDTFVLSPIDDLFNILEYFDLLICLDYFDKSLINGDRTDLKSFTPYNTGVQVYRKSDRLSKLHDLWQVAYEKNLDVYWSDQPAFMEALMQCDVKAYTLPTNYNFRFLNNVGLLHEEPVKIIHGRADDKEVEIIANRVNRTLSNRAWVAPLRRSFSWKDSRSGSVKVKLYRLLPSRIKDWFRQIFVDR